MMHATPYFAIGLMLVGYAGKLSAQESTATATADNSVPAETSTPDTKTVQKQISDYWIGQSRKHAETYSIAPTDSPGDEFKLYKHPVFQHIQTVRGNDIGAVHIWLDKMNRPAVLGTVFGWTTSNTTRMLFNELHSLSDVPVSANQAGRALWQSETPGTKWAAVPNAPTPKSSPRLRRIQAKAIAKKFTSHTIDRKKERFELRRVPSPIYEYDLANDKTRGGAVFVFCTSTDIETVIWLEVRNSEGQPRWEFTCAKFTDYEPHIQYAKRDVWEPFEDAYLENGNPHFWAPVGTRPMPQVEKDYRARL